MNNNPDYQAGSRGESMQFGGDLTAWRAGQAALQRQRDEEVAQSQRNFAAFNELMVGTSKLHDFVSTPTYVSSARTYVSQPPEKIILTPLSIKKSYTPPILPSPEEIAAREIEFEKEKRNRLIKLFAVTGAIISLPFIPITSEAYNWYKKEKENKQQYEAWGKASYERSEVAKSQEGKTMANRPATAAITQKLIAPPPVPPMPEAPEVNDYAQQAFDEYYSATGDHLRGKVDDYLRTGTTTYRADSRGSVTMTFNDRDTPHLTMQFNRGGLAYTTTILSSPEDGALCGRLTTSVKPAGTREEDTTYPPTILCNTP